MQLNQEKIENLMKSILEELKGLKDFQNYQQDIKLNREWLDVQDACLMLRISKRTLYEYKAKGIIPFSQISGKLYFKRIDIQNLLNNNYMN